MSIHKKQCIDVRIRWITRRDMRDVLEIEESCFEFLWSEDDFIRCLRRRNCVGMIAEQDGCVVGFMVYELHKTKLHILNFAVNKKFHRRQIGSQMIKKLLDKLSYKLYKCYVILEVRETNLAAQLFFRKAGFSAISILHNFYDDTAEDAYLMRFICETTTQKSINHNITA